jgi:methylglyoxal synthase
MKGRVMEPTGDRAVDVGRASPGPVGGDSHVDANVAAGAHPEVVLAPRDLVDSTAA